MISRRIFCKILNLLFEGGFLDRECSVNFYVGLFEKLSLDFFGLYRIRFCFLFVCIELLNVENLWEYGVREEVVLEVDLLL